MKRYKACSIFLGMTIMLLSVASCGGQGSQPSSEQPEEEQESLKQPEEVLLNSFEGYEDIYDFNYTGAFRLDCVEDTEYVTDGKYALKYTVGRQDADKTTAYVFGVPLYSLDGTENYRDFSRAKTVTYDVYNASDTDITLATSILQKTVGQKLSNNQKTTLKAGERATVSYEINRCEIFFSLGLDGPTHVNITVKGEDPEVYFDNMRICYSPDEFEVPEMTLDEDELISFEKAYQSFAIYTTGMTLKAEVITDPMIAYEGMRCLRVYREDIEDGTVLYAGGKVGISAKVLENINFDLYGGDSYITFDYMTSWKGTDMWTVPRLVSSSSAAYANITGLMLPCDGCWHTVCIPLSFAPAFFDYIEIDFQGGTYGDVYLDNFRMERTLPQDAIVAKGYN